MIHQGEIYVCESDPNNRVCRVSWDGELSVIGTESVTKQNFAAKGVKSVFARVALAPFGCTASLAGKRKPQWCCECELCRLLLGWQGQCDWHR